MVLFVGELPMETQYTVWNLFFIKGSTVIFRVALTILKLIEDKILSHAQLSVENSIQVINSFSQTNIS